MQRALLHEGELVHRNPPILPLAIEALRPPKCFPEKLNHIPLPYVQLYRVIVLIEDTPNTING